MTTTIPNSDDPGRLLKFVDTWQKPASQLAQTGDCRRYQFVVSGEIPLRICLAWSDLPGRALQNNLNLFLQHLPTGRKWAGNEDLPLRLQGIPDPENNVEVLRLDAPAAGPYLIQITASNLLRGPQDFALVVTGDPTTDLIPI